MTEDAPLTTPAQPRRRASRRVGAALIGAEVGAAVGLIGFGATPLAPLALVAAGAAAGPLVLAWTRAARVELFRRQLRRRLRASH